MATDPFGNRYPTSTNAPNVPQDIQNAVLDLAGDTVPRFPTTTARDTAFTSRVSAGYPMENGMSTWSEATGAFFDRIAGAWAQRTRTAGSSFSGTTDASGLITANHVLGVVPTNVQLTRTGYAAANISDGRITAVSSTQIQVVVNRTDTGAVLASNGVAFYLEVSI